MWDVLHPSKLLLRITEEMQWLPRSLFLGTLPVFPLSASTGVILRRGSCQDSHFRLILCVKVCWKTLELCRPCPRKARGEQPLLHQPNVRVQSGRLFFPWVVTGFLQELLPHPLCVTPLRSTAAYGVAIETHPTSPLFHLTPLLSSHPKPPPETVRPLVWLYQPISQSCWNSGQ